MKIESLKKISRVKKIFMVIGSLAVTYLFVFSIASLVIGQEHSTAEKAASVVLTAEKAAVMRWGYLAAAIAVGLGSVGAGIAVGSVGSAALGVISERPDLAARALIFVGLAEGIAIYGMVLALMIISKI